ncbi:MAG TPA: M13 family metallopeptidase [Stellaceae bacterium]|nr:M13 family metallopeptidase [Stellaceae bacterium]
MIRPFALALASTALMGVAQPAPAPTQAPVAAAGTAPKPQYGTFGFDTAGTDNAIKAGDNFYGFADGTWSRNTAIPADKSNYGAFNVLDDLSHVRTQEILEAAKSDPNSKIGTAYAAYLDTGPINAKGLAPITPWLDQIRGLKSKAGYAAVLAKADRNGVDSPFSSYVGQDDKDPDSYVMNLSQSGLGMPDRDYYLSPDAKLAAAKVAYQKHIAAMLKLAGEPNAAARASAIVNFETAIAKISWTNVQNRDSEKTYNKMSIAELAKSAPGFDFADYFNAKGAKVGDVVVAQPSAVSGIAKLVQDAPLGVLKDQLLVRSLDAFADVLPTAFDQENFAFYGTTLSGTPEQQLRWKRAVDYTVGSLTDDVSKIYVGKYFPPESKAAADEIVKNIIGAMNRRIDALDWMTSETKAKAHLKLAAFTPRIGYPSQWHDYAAMEVVADDAFGNNLRSNQWHSDDNIAKLGSSVRRWEWGMTPMTINAQANPTLVAITFPAAILQPPFFDPNADPAVNYGGIGAVIGHEMSHHFDDQGAKYDLHGKLTAWWTPADTAAFQSRLDKLEQEYNAYEPLPGMHVNGKLTMGENVADLAGLTVAHDAYIASLNGAAPPVIDDTTGDQRFYLGWAQVWRRNYREPNLRQRLLTDPHSPSEQRANIVRNMDPWYPAFNVQPGQKLYLAPANRVRIW